MPHVLFRKWKEYSGALIRGTGQFLPREDFTFWEKAVWLTTQVESGGRFGTIISYDGTGITAGITQTIAVYPRELESEDGNALNDQGPLWNLLNQIREANPKTTYHLEAALKEKNLVLNSEGVLLKLPEEEVAAGQYIRNVLSPTNGKVKRFTSDWKTTKQWALLFNEVFANPDSYEAQVLHSVNHLQTIVNRKNRHCDIQKLFEVYDEDIHQESSIQLAMSIFLSFSVNAPSMAYRKMRQALEIEKALSRDKRKAPQSQDLARRIIRVFGTSNFGRWNMSHPHGRYQRTRKAAMKLWPEIFFIGSGCVMPKRL